MIRCGAATGTECSPCYRRLGLFVRQPHQCRHADPGVAADHAHRDRPGAAFYQQLKGGRGSPGSIITWSTPPTPWPDGYRLSDAWGTSDAAMLRAAGDHEPQISSVVDPTALVARLPMPVESGNIALRRPKCRTLARARLASRMIAPPLLGTELEGIVGVLRVPGGEAAA